MDYNSKKLKQGLQEEKSDVTMLKSYTDEDLVIF